MEENACKEAAMSTKAEERQPRAAVVAVEEVLEVGVKRSRSRVSPGARERATETGTSLADSLTHMHRHAHIPTDQIRGDCVHTTLDCAETVKILRFMS